MEYFLNRTCIFNVPYLDLFIELVGFGYLFFYVLIKLPYKLAMNIGPFLLNLGGVNLRSYGKWALITGCTDGIGKAYAEYIAKEGINLVLISRTLDKLNEQAGELEDKFKIKTKVIAADFTEPDSIYPNIKAQIAHLDIGILINNVGIGYKHPEFFDVFAQNESNINAMINCNIISCTKMTAICLPKMLKKKKGIIINNSSGSGRIPTPMLTVYSATKAYMDFFSQALSIEYRQKGIIVQSLCPYYVSTKLSRVRKSFTTPTPDQFVASAIKTIGIQTVTNGCFVHNFQGQYLEKWFPRFIYNKGAMSKMLKARERALSKTIKCN